MEDPLIPVDGTHPEVAVAGLNIRVEKLQDRRVEWAEISIPDAGRGEDEEKQ